MFDVNDFDETLPGPFEWDVKRLAASLAVAGRDNGFSAEQRRSVSLAGVQAYRTAMREFADMPLLGVWYAHLDVEDAIAEFRLRLAKKGLKKTEKLLAKAHTRDSMQALGKLTTMVEGRRRIISDPPLIVPVEELFTDMQADALYAQINERPRRVTPRTLQSDRRHLVAAVRPDPDGAQGRRCRQRRHPRVDPAARGRRRARNRCSCRPRRPRRPCWPTTAGAATTTTRGERVVAGQHLMQASSDIFLGWQRTTGPDGVERDFYIRQLRDWKFSFPIELMLPRGMAVYAGLCGWTLARAHARSGDRVALAAYLGKTDKFDTAIAEFAETYADQNERDHAALAAAVAEGRAEARSGL